MSDDAATALADPPRRAPSGERRASLQRRAEWGLLAIGAIVSVVLLPHAVDGDGGVRAGMLATLVDHGRAPAGRYSLLQPLLTVPLWALGGLLGDPLRVAAYFNTIVLFTGLALIARLSWRHVDRDVLRRFLLLVLAASMFPHHLGNYYGEVLSAVAIAVGLLLLARGSFAAGSAAAVAGVVNTPAAAGGLLLVCLRRAWRTRRWVRSALPLVAAAALVAVDQWVRNGSPLHSGYANDHGFATILPYSGRPGFSYPLVLGLASLLFSFGKGIVFFAPGLALPFLLPRAARSPLPSPTEERFRRLCMLFLLGLILVYAKWWSWYSGFFWGPRFLLFAAFPASLVLARHLGDSARGAAGDLLVLGVLALSVWVAADGAVFAQRGMEICRADDYALEFLCWYVPEFSALARPFVAPRPVSRREALLLGYYALVAVTLARPIVARLGRRAWRAGRKLAGGAR
ncbi:MAG TPA: hypothetical protein VF041_07590 [Gemmatimonadaceae bacterium]